MNKTKIFVDMDGVLVNFQSGIDKLDEATKREYADDPSTGSGQVGKAHYDDVPGIFSLMDPMPGAIEGVRALKDMGYDLYILSTAPWGNPSAWSDKVAWITKHLDDVFHKKMIITHCKGLLAAQEGAYLIDDRTGHGASDFGERHIQFGTTKFPDWNSVVSYFKDLKKMGKVRIRKHFIDSKILEEKIVDDLIFSPHLPPLFQGLLDDCHTPEALSIINTLKEMPTDQLEKKLNTLSIREREVMRKLIGLDYRSMSVDEVADYFELLPSRIRQIRNMALKKINSQKK